MSDTISKHIHYPFFLAMLGYLLVIILFAGFGNESNTLLVILGTLPLLFYVVAIYVMLERHLVHTTRFWIMPFVPLVLFFVLWASGVSPMISQMDITSILTWQLIIMVILNFLIGITHVQHVPENEVHYHKHVKPHESHPHHKNYIKENEPHQYEKVVHQYANQAKKYYDHASKLAEQNQEYQSHIHKVESELASAKQKLEISQENFAINLRSIEDKAKAINFSIGRVYSDKRGGSAQIREKLNISRELYNTFSELSANYSKSKIPEILDVLTQIKMKLDLYSQTESSQFYIKKQVKLPLLRDKDGADTIEEVLANNDSDPVKDYIADAREVTEKLITFLEKQ